MIYKLKNFISNALFVIIIGSILYAFLEISRIYSFINTSETVNIIITWFFVGMVIIYRLKRSKYKFIGEIPGIPYIYKKIRDDYKKSYSSTEELLFLSGFICLGSFINTNKNETALIDSIYQAAEKYKDIEDEPEMLVKFGSKILGLELQYLNFFEHAELNKNPSHIIDIFMSHLEEIKKKTEFAYFTTYDISIKKESLELAKEVYKNHRILIKEKFGNQNSGAI